MAVAPPAPRHPLGDGPVDQRARILEIALELMAEAGVHAMSMRRLATACGLNVATLYHYFPSKADLLHEVIAYQQYEELLAQTPPIDGRLPPGPRLGALLRWIWQEMSSQDDMWLLLLGESLRRTPEVLEPAASLSAEFEAALNRWLAELFADLPGDRAVLARVLRGLVYGFFVEHLPLPPEERQGFLATRADEIAAVLVPGK